jgi:hypothetical protein
MGCGEEKQEVNSVNYAEIMWRKQMLQCYCIGVAPIPAKVMPVYTMLYLPSLSNRLNTQCYIRTIHTQDKRAFVGREANTDMTHRGLVAGTHQPRSLSN